MRIVYMGTPLFALPSLERLCDSQHEVLAVVTQPDRKKGRGRKTKDSIIKQTAVERGIPLLQPERVRDPEFIEQIRSLAPDMIVVAAYGQILPTAILEIPKYGCVNLHASLLPEYRGAAPINWAIVNGASDTGVTIMQMDAGMDTGAIIAQEAIPILEDDDASSLCDMLSAVGADRLLRVIDEAESADKVESVPQDASKATYAPLLKKTDGVICWEKTAEEVLLLIRGMTPWPAAQTRLDSDEDTGTIKILKAEMLWPDAIDTIKGLKDMQPGTVALALKTHGFAVATGDGVLLITQAQPAGKRVLSGVDMLNGKLVRVGDRFSKD